MMRKVIFITAPAWCGACRQFEPILEKATRQLGWELVTVDSDADPATAANYEVQSLPTAVLIEGGFEVGRIVGAYPLNKTLTLLQEANNG